MDEPPPTSFADPSAPERARARRAQLRYAPNEARALGVLALLAGLAILWVVVPVGIGVLLGALLAFTTYQHHRRLARRTGKPGLSAFLLTAAATLLVAATVGIIGYLLVLQGFAVAEKMPEALGPGGAVTQLTDRLRAPLKYVGVDASTVVDRARHSLGGLSSQLAGLAADVLELLFEGVLSVFFMALTMFFVLRHWVELTKRAEHLLPFNPRHTRHLLRQVRKIGRTVVIGNFGTAAVQGVLGGVGYALGHLPQAALLGALTSLASLVPVVGTMVIWVPAGLVPLVLGKPHAGIFELAWGLLVTTTFCDYVVRPRLVGSGDSSSTWLTFVGLFGGIKLFGFVGLLLGPLIVGVSVASLRIYERVRRFRLRLR